MAELKENCIEWLTGDDKVLCTLTQKKFINKVRRMAKKRDGSVEILAENEDGSILARIPLRAVHLTIYEARGTGFCAKDKDGDANG